MGHEEHAEHGHEAKKGGIKKPFPAYILFWVTIIMFIGVMTYKFVHLNHVNHGEKTPSEVILKPNESKKIDVPFGLTYTIPEGEYEYQDGIKKSGDDRGQNVKYFILHNNTDHTITVPIKWSVH